MTILFIRSHTTEFDGRIQKYLKTLDKYHINYSFLGWNRDPKQPPIVNDKTFYFNKHAKIGSGWKNLFNIILWNLFISYFIIKNNKKFQILHIIDFDSYLLPFFISKLLRKNVIFDIYDKYTSSRNIPKPINYVVDYLEKFYIKKSKYSFLADESRIKQHNLSSIKNIEIFENVPQPIKLKKEPQQYISNNIKIGYFGIFEKQHRGLENLLNVIAAHNNLELHISGFGSLENLIEEYNQKYPNKIHYYGALDHNSGMRMMENVDIMIGLYYKTIKNHLYAAPNKYFEHLMLGKPLVTSMGTPPGYKVIKHKTGWAINDDIHSLDSLLVNISKEEIKEYSKNALNLWEIKYKSYSNSRYEIDYINIINSILKK